MILRMVFLICAVLALICFAVGIRVKRKNNGYLITTALLVVCDIVVFFVLGSNGIEAARRSLLIYYMFHCWLYFGALYVLILMSGAKKLKKPFLCISAIICAYQTAIIFSNFFGSRLIKFSRHVVFGTNWWVAEKSGAGNAIWSFGCFRGLLFVNAILIILAGIIGLYHLPGEFRGRLYATIGFQILYSILEFLSFKYSWPVWIASIVMTPICVSTLYIANFYPDKKLINWTLLRFANDMSDGVILYNEYDDPLFMNDVLRNILSEDLITLFRDRSKLEEWLSASVNIEGIDVVICGNVDGEFYFKSRKVELAERGRYLGTVYVLHNTTDSIMKLSAMREANVELERAAKMKSDFLANMSHEIRTPMNAVIGMAELSLREKRLPDNVRDYLSQIQSSGKNLLNIINDILDYSKIEAGKMEIFWDKYEPLSEINDIANILISRIGDKPIELFVTSSADVPHALMGDAMRIRQIIINLAGNAIKFTKRGMVHIKVDCDRISDEEVMMNYHIIDTGTGIKEEEIKNLFESFNQLDAKRNRTVEGTGLGLAISRRLCEAMNGTIGVTSEYGVGSDFYFSIPQRIMDETKELIVRDAENKYAYVLNENEDMVKMFVDDIKKLGVNGGSLRTLEDYIPSPGQDFVFFIEEMYGESVRKFLRENPKTVGVVLVDFDSKFEEDMPNLRVMRRPETTLNLVLILNGEKQMVHSSVTAKAYRIDFMAPDARILIVDDNEINITIAEGLMEPLKATCIGALSGAEAIDRIKHEHYDIVFMDHMMPEMDGIEATKIIRNEIPEALTLPIIALTANVVEGIKDQFIIAGMNDFVAKPIDVRDLAEKLKLWLPSGLVKERPEEEDEEEEKKEYFDCLDNERAIASLGSDKLFIKIVGEYYRSGAEKLELIKQAYDREDWTDYTIRVHALKSSSRQIGAYELGDMAEELEKAGKELNLNKIREKTDKALKRFDELLANLSRYFPEEKGETKKAAISDDKLDGLLDNMLRACEDLDMDSMEEICDELKKYELPGLLGEEFKSFVKAVEDIDADAVSDIIARFRG